MAFSIRSILRGAREIITFPIKYRKSLCGIFVSPGQVEYWIEVDIPAIFLSYTDAHKAVFVIQFERIKGHMCTTIRKEGNLIQTIRWEDWPCYKIARCKQPREFSRACDIEFPHGYISTSETFDEIFSGSSLGDSTFSIQFIAENICGYPDGIWRSLT